MSAKHKVPGTVISTPTQSFLNPFQRFFQQETSGGILLFIAALAAIFLANSPWRQNYFDLRHLELSIGLGQWALNMSMHSWINDGLMSLFFLLVGLELKRELWVGELSSFRQAALPIFAAIGGMLIPGVLYILLNPPGSEHFQGWGIPMVTDIAFSLGILALLGERVPAFLKIFLTALAIVDDLGAILIIALFYSKGVAWHLLGYAGAVFVVLVLFNRLNARWLPAYLLSGALLWGVMLFSGIHATIAGVLLAFTIPIRSKIQVDSFYEQGFSILKALSNDPSQPVGPAILTESVYQSGVQNIETLCEAVQAPLQRLEHTLHPWVTYGVIPIFAFANAGVSLSFENFSAMLSQPMAWGIVAGLFFGKQLGITLFTWISVKCRLGDIPSDIGWKPMYGLASLGGLGFTMSLFIADLAFQGAMVDTAKLAIFIASLMSGLWGWAVLRWNLTSCLTRLAAKA